MGFLNASFRVGRLFGIDVRVHILFVFYVVWRLVQALGEAAGMAILMAVLFGVILLHEFGHCFGARAMGGDARDILMWPLGGLAFAHAPMRPWPQFVTVACGPLVNLGFCVVGAAILLARTGAWELVLINPFGGILRPEGGMHWLAYVWAFYQLNLMLLAFNLLPIYPLDGGQLFQAAVWPLVGLRRATELACYVGLGGCALLAAWGLRGRGEMLLFIALFGGMTCFQRLQMLRYGMVIEDEHFRPYGDTGRFGRRRGFWSRLFGGGAARRPAPRPAEPLEPVADNPNPGGWQAKLEERQRLEGELDRILKKVREHGIHSLNYVERQTLERATRERQQREREFDRQTRL